jgi:hypothetical protein
MTFPCSDVVSGAHFERAPRPFIARLAPVVWKSKTLRCNKSRERLFSRRVAVFKKIAMLRCNTFAQAALDGLIKWNSAAQSGKFIK